MPNLPTRILAAAMAAALLWLPTLGNPANAQAPAALYTLV